MLAIVTGGSDVPDASTRGDATLFVKAPGERRQRLADLERYELRHNPDGQTQFDPNGEPLDALSNPFAVLGRRGPGFVFVADAGANAVLSVSRSGKVRTFFVPPLVTTGACKGAPNNHPNDPKGCDPVPTGLAYGPGGKLYVSTLSAEAPRQGRVYVLNARTGKVLDVIRGFTAPTGVAVGPRARCTCRSCCTTLPKVTRRQASTPRRSGASCGSHPTARGRTRPSRCRSAWCGTTAASTRRPGASPASSSAFPMPVKW